MQTVRMAVLLALLLVSASFSAQASDDFWSKLNLIGGGASTVSLIHRLASAHNWPLIALDAGSVWASVYSGDSKVRTDNKAVYGAVNTACCMGSVYELYKLAPIISSNIFGSSYVSLQACVYLLQAALTGHRVYTEYFSNPSTHTKSS